MFDILALSDADRYAIWAKGIAKELAYVNFCDVETKSRFMTLRDAARSAVRQKDKALFASIKEKAKAGEEFKLSMMPVDDPKERTEFEEFDDKLKGYMIKAIKDGDFIVLGYQSPRGINDAPKPVPLDVWDQFDPWHGNSFKLGSIEITDVRITLKRSVVSYFEALPEPEPVVTIQTIGIASAQAPLAPSRSGRKSRKEEILAAYSALVAGGVVTNDTPTAVLGHEVREYIFQDISSSERRETGLSDETIRRTIRSTK